MRQHISPLHCDSSLVTLYFTYTLALNFTRLSSGAFAEIEGFIVTHRKSAQMRAHARTGQREMCLQDIHFAAPAISFLPFSVSDKASSCLGRGEGKLRWSRHFMVGKHSTEDRGCNKGVNILFWDK